MKRFLLWWSSTQGFTTQSSTIDKMQVSLLQNEYHKAAAIMKARYNNKQKSVADKTVISVDTDHNDLEHLTVDALRRLLSNLAKQCGEALSGSALKIQHRNVLIAAIIDRRDTIDQAMGSIVSRPLVLSDDSDDESTDYSDSDESMSDHANSRSDSANGYDTQGGPDIDGYYKDMPKDLEEQLAVSNNNP